MTHLPRLCTRALFFALALVAIVPLSAQDARPESPQSRSYVNNEFQLLSRRYIQWAEEALNNGDFDASIEYSALARENADLSDAYVQKMIERDLAEKKIFRAETRLTWAEETPVVIQRPEPVIAPAEGDSTVEESAAVSFESSAAVFVAAKDALALAHNAFDSEDFKIAADHAQVALDALAWLSAAPPSLPTDDTRPWRIGDPGLPRYYVVQRWSVTGDCFWNISAKPFVYGTPWQWRRIYNANSKRLINPANPDRIAPGTVLEIPVRPGETRSGTYNSARK
jgi:nucleoid-associated protein YgaU